MNVSGINFSGVPTPLPEGRKESKAQPGSNSSRKDRVEISSDSRSRDSTSAGIAALAAAGEPTREERIQEVRRKLDDGFYDQPEVIEQTAQKLIDKKLI